MHLSSGYNVKKSKCEDLIMPQLVPHLTLRYPSSIRNQEILQTKQQDQVSTAVSDSPCFLLPGTDLMTSQVSTFVRNLMQKDYPNSFMMTQHVLSLVIAFLQTMDVAQIHIFKRVVDITGCFSYYERALIPGDRIRTIFEELEYHCLLERYFKYLMVGFGAPLSSFMLPPEVSDESNNKMEDMFVAFMLKE